MENEFGNAIIPVVSQFAMQAGLIKRLMSIEDIANLVVNQAPKKRCPYKKEG